MDDREVIDYLKNNYSKIVINPIYFKEFTDDDKAFGFILSKNKLILGYINKNGYLVKLIDPIDINKFKTEIIDDLIKKIPVIEGLSEDDKIKLLDMLEEPSTKKIENNNPVITQLNSILNEETQAVKPEDQLVKAETQAVKAETQAVEPETQAVNPETQVAVPETQVAVPETPAVKPEDQLIKPEEKPVKPEEKPVKLEIKKRKRVKIGKSNKMKEAENYKILIGDKNSNFKNAYLLVKEEHSNIISQIREQYKKVEEANELFKDRILHEKGVIMDAIKDFKMKMEQTARSAVKDILSSKKFEMVDVTKAFDNLNKMYKKFLKDKMIIEDNFNSIKKREDKNLEKIINKEDILTDFSYQLQYKEDEIKKLNANIEAIENELKNVTEKYKKENLERMAANDYKKSCFDHILKEKEEIINRIKEYNDKWSEWSQYALHNIDSINGYTDKLIEESKEIFENLKDILRDKTKYIKSLELDGKDKDQLIKNLNNNIEEIKFQTEKVINDQIVQLGLKTEEIKQREQMIQDKEKEMDQQQVEYQDTIEYLQSELDKVNKLLESQRSQKVDFKKLNKKDNIENCYGTLQRFIGVNNMFYRKKEILKILDSIILDESKLSLFHNLSDPIKLSIKNDYLKVKDDINKHITFLDLEKYINSPNIEYFKSKDTYDQIPAEFCEELFDISEYWLNNINLYKSQDRILTNIYEDLSGAIRVYIKIKPLQPPTDVIKINDNLKSLSIECSGRKETFGDFYGVFDGSYSNMDVFTGNYKVESVENIGLYNSFRQVEDGYSIVLFGYGISGSGKTTLLLGESGAKIPGILHHGISNLQGVKNIRVRNIFEQYIKDFVPTINKMKGRIHELVGTISKLKEYCLDEKSLFQNELPANINLDNIKIDNLYTITNILEKYRNEKKRIKMTPNNPVSSRSHLYIVLEITFESGKTGYITVVDTAGREKPYDIYNKFLETTRPGVNLTTILGPTGGIGLIDRYMKKEYLNMYDSKHIYNLLREGFYINETLNHLVYYFNKKNYKDPKILMETSLDKYSSNKYYVDPRKEEGLIDPNNNCLTIPIMKFLDSLSKKKDDKSWKPTKFITFICLRQEDEFCNETFETMEFANRIKST